MDRDEPGFHKTLFSYNVSTQLGLPQVQDEDPVGSKHCMKIKFYEILAHRGPPFEFMNLAPMVIITAYAKCRKK